MRADPNKPVWVYRNLKHGRNSRPLYSVMQNGRVLYRTHRVLLNCVKFVVREAGRKRVVETGKKNVHAFVVGVTRRSSYGQTAERDLPVTIKYNPFDGPQFYAMGVPIALARAVVLNENGMTGAYITCQS